MTSILDTPFVLHVRKYRPASSTAIMAERIEHARAVIDQRRRLALREVLDQQNGKEQDLRDSAMSSFVALVAVDEILQGVARDDRLFG